MYNMFGDVCVLVQVALVDELWTILSQESSLLK